MSLIGKLGRFLKSIFVTPTLLYLGIPGSVIFFVIIGWLYIFVFSDPVLYILQELSADYSSNSFMYTIITGVISSFFAAILLAFIGIVFFNWYQKTLLTGRYKATELILNGDDVDWGVVTIKFIPFETGKGYAVKLILMHGDIELEGNGRIIDNRYLIGHYVEIGKLERRRMGSFFYELNGAGNAWEGNYVYVDPNESDPKQGRAKWERM